MKLSEEEREEMRILFRRASIFISIASFFIIWAILYIIKTKQ